VVVVNSNAMLDFFQILITFASLVMSLAVLAHPLETPLAVLALQATSLNGWVSLVNLIVTMENMETRRLTCACYAIILA
jgi:hypothetical protein